MMFSGRDLMIASTNASRIGLTLSFKYVCTSALLFSIFKQYSNCNQQRIKRITRHKMKEQQTITVDKLRLLPFSELRNLRGYLGIIKTEFIPEDPYNLYLHLLKYPSLSEEQLSQVLERKQPLPIIESIYNESLLDTHLADMTLSNTFAFLRLFKDKVGQDRLRAILINYFQFKDQEDMENTPRSSKVVIQKEILSLIKHWHSNSQVSVSDLLAVLEPLYEGIKSSDLQSLFKLVQLVISLENYHFLGFLPQSEKFKSDVVQGFLLFSSGICNFMTPNIYLELAKHHHDQCKEVEIFIDLYSTLNSFGVHLIKDLWEQFNALCNSKVKLNYLSLDTLMGILLRKVNQHCNENIPKNCIRDFLKSQNLDYIVLFTEHQDVVYNQIIPLLNTGQFYVDCSLQKDSKFSKYVYNFFSRAYNTMDKPSLSHHLKVFLSSVSRYITYDQALPAFLMVFNKVKQDVPFFGESEIGTTIKLVQKVYKNVHMRKRWQIINGILQCLKRFRAEVIGVKHLFDMILAIPDEAYKWKFIHDDDEEEALVEKYSHRFNLRMKLKAVLETVSEEELVGEINRLTEESFANVGAIPSLYRLLRIHQWVPFVQLNDKIRELSSSAYSTSQEYDIVILHMYYQSLEGLVSWSVTQSLTLIKWYILEHYHCFYDKQILSVVSNIAKQALSNQNPTPRQQLAKFVEWLTHSISNPTPSSQLSLYLLYQLLLLIITLQHSLPQPQLQIQQTLYSLPQTLHTLSTPKQNRYPSIKLRIEVALATLLSKDKSFKNQSYQQLIDDPLSLMDRYDYEYYSEMFYFFKNEYLPVALREQRYKELDQLQDLIHESLLSNLEYSIKKQDILSYFSFILDDRILSSKPLWDSGTIQKWFHKLIKTGTNYVYFHRILANTLYKYLITNYHTIVQQQTLLNYVDIFYQLLQLEEYRGFDSEVAFYEEEREINVIEFRKGLPEKAEYFGMYVRFLFMKFIEDRFSGSARQYQKIEEEFVMRLTERVFKFSIEDETANRMMFSPSFRSKLRLWQFMQVLVPFFAREDSLHHIKTLLPLFVKQLQQPNQPQIKHYIQLFLTRVILSHPALFHPIFINKLKSQTTLTHSITNIIISGLILNNQFNEQLYNSILSLICHNTAYLRGLTQYFCFYNFQAFQSRINKTSLIRKLYDQFITNPDSIKLADRLHALMTHYRSQINNTSLSHFCGLEIYKAGEIVEEYVQDGLKRIGLEIVREIKHNDEGFILMKELWKREAEQYLPKEVVGTEQSKGFQKKIDPVIEELYSVEKLPSITKLRIMASSLESVYTYGHLVRTGEIFSVEELCIREKSILSDDSFKSVSCTGEKWLNIKEVGIDHTSEYILGCMDEGYVPVIISENRESVGLREFQIPEKVLLILPNEQKQFQPFIRDLPVNEVHIGTGLSVHVQSAIFIWEYVKRNIIQGKP